MKTTDYGFVIFGQRVLAGWKELRICLALLTLPIHLTR